MTRKEKLDIIFSQFDKSAKEFCGATNGAFCEISSQYKGEENTENLKYRFAKIYYNSFVVKFIYTAHGFMGSVNSILECTVSLDKIEDSLEIPLPLVTDYCDMNFTTPMCIPFITNKEGMKQAFDCIGSVLGVVLDKLEQISYDAERKGSVLTAFAEEIKYIFDLENADEISEDMGFYIDFFTLRFSTGAFISGIKGNKAKAVRQLKKIKKLTGYEKRMIALWESQNGEAIPEMSAILTSLQAYNDAGMPKADFRELGALFLSWLALTPLTSAVYLGIYFLLVLVEGLNSVYLMGPVYNFPICIGFGFLTAIGLSYFTRLKFCKLFFGKNFERYCEMDQIQNSAGSDRFMKKFLGFLVIVSVVGCLLLAKWNLNFKAGGFTDNSKFFSLTGEYHTYSEIEKVYYKPDRINAFDETINYPSYVLVLKSGEEIDLYEHGEISDYEQDLLKLFESKNIKIEK